MACDPLVRTRPKKVKYHKVTTLQGYPKGVPEPLEDQGTESTIRDHVKIIKQLHEDEFLYGITITFPDKLRFRDYLSPNEPKRHECLWKQSINNQLLITSRFIQKTFKDFKFILYEEYTQRGIIHYHGIIWHPDYKVENSRIKACIFKKLRRCGKANCTSNSLQKISNIDSWSSYIHKEQGYFVCNCKQLKDPIGTLDIDYERDRLKMEGPTFLIRKHNSIFNYLDVSDDDE